tara:strand:- start:775 stop:1002 length:228 start_codon:yes stop_codon:yes gene_type:complete
MNFLQWLFCKSPKIEQKYKRGNKIKKWAKAGKSGERILCPNCNHDVVVPDFTWLEATCRNCDKTSSKYDWFEVEQ